MSLAAAISTGIIMVMIIYVLMTMPGIVDNVIVFDETDTIATNLENSIQETNINFMSMGATLGSNIITGTISNNGTEKLWNYAKFDFIIRYNGTTGGNQIQQLTYSGECGGSNPATGKWCIDSFLNDQVDKKILNKNESINIKGATAQNLNRGKVIATFSTDSGVTTTQSSIIT